jgi:hypothetical protein
MPTIWFFFSPGVAEDFCVAEKVVRLPVAVAVVRYGELVIVMTVEVTPVLVVMLDIVEGLRELDVVAEGMRTTPDVPRASVAVIVLWVFGNAFDCPLHI